MQSDGQTKDLHSATGGLQNVSVAKASLSTGQVRPNGLLESNLTLREYPYDKCVHQLFEEQVERTPESAAIFFENQRLTYRELNQRANQLARHLQLQGVGPDMPVGICLERSLELLVALFGVLKAGGAYVPLDPNYPPERIAYMLEKTQARVLIQAGTIKVNMSSEIKVIRLDAEWPVIAVQSSANLISLATIENLIYIIFTSGSTGQPKGAAIRHGGFSNLLQWFVTDFGINEKDRTLIGSSISFDLTQKNLYAPLLSGGTLYLYPSGPYDAALIAQLIRDWKITLINCTPSAFYPLVEQADEHSFRSLASLRLVFLGGETISISRIRHWLNHPLCHAELINTYGPTECTDIGGFYRLNRENIDQYEFVPLGKPINNVQFVILDESLQLSAAGAPGELCIGGAGVSAGYINDPEMTTAKFVPNPFSGVSGKYIYCTGDRVRMLADGNIEFLGRLDQQVKIRGFRIELGEIESVLSTHPNIQSAVVIAREDNKNEKFLAAYIIARNLIGPTLSELREFLKARLPDYMMPLTFVTLKSFPLNPNGKVDRKALAASKGDDFGQEAGFLAPRSATEERLAKIWSEVFGQKQIGINDNFFELGGHSLLAIRVINEIKKSLNLSLPLPIFFRNPTIEGIALSLQQENQNGFEPKLIPLHAGKSSEIIYFLDAGIGLCRLAQLVDTGPSSFATIVPLPPTALESAILNKMDGLPGLETLAAAHTAIILKHQHSGRCILTGHSFGGLLAFEVAHQLQRQGKKVEMILLLDSWAVFPSWWRRLRTLSWAHAQASLKYRTGHLWWKIKRRIFRKMQPQFSDANSTPTLTPPANGEPASKVPSEVPWEILEKIYRTAMKKYRLHHLDSRAVLFRARDSDQAHLYKIDGTLGWKDFFNRGFEIVETSGDHFSLLLPPHVDRIADRIKKLF